MEESQKLNIIKTKHAKGATPEELWLFIYMAKKYDLDILAGHLVFVKYWNKRENRYDPAKIYASRDGFLHIAHKSKQFDGMDTTITTDDEGQYIATCRVYRKDFKHPIVQTVWEGEYNTGKNLWKTKRRTMTGKVAESQALRKAFDIAGLYDRDEVGDDGDYEVVKQIESDAEKQFEGKKALTWSDVYNKIGPELSARTKAIMQNGEGFAFERMLKFFVSLDFDTEKIKLVYDTMNSLKIDIKQSYKVCKEAGFKVSQYKKKSDKVEEEEEAIMESIEEEDKEKVTIMTEGSAEENYEI